MADYEDFKASNKGRGSSNRGSSRRGSRDRGSSRRGSRSSGRDRGDREMTRVTCSECGEKCEVPFKPTSNKPLFCSDCFQKQDKGSKGSVDLSEVNEKLDKIMNFLKIE
tara:strand:+ start:1060 stop:1386 length:327 start_codon:yes stop_codon:yes gene_type:complete